MRTFPTPELWGLCGDADGKLCLGSVRLTALAKEYGTPLHVVNEMRLEQTAQSFIKKITDLYPGASSVHYAFKCNSVPGVVQMIHKAGLKAEVMSMYELQLASLLGYTGEKIIVNGPCKSTDFLRSCIEHRVRFIVIDSIAELLSLGHLSDEYDREISVLLRVNPDIIPKGMNSGSATGSRKGSPFGLDVKGGEVIRALELISGMQRIRFCGYHFHIGTGIRNPADYSRTLYSLKPLFEKTGKLGFSIDVIDAGGGFASPTTRELTSTELLLYQSFNRFPKTLGRTMKYGIGAFIKEITGALIRLFPEGKLPELILEPGRCIVSPNQLLLLTVHRIKERPGVGTWLITDGGLGTVTMPTYYEYHEVFLCNDINRQQTKLVTISGPGCFAADIVYKNKKMPEVRTGERLAVMDSGAYFTALESSFGYPLPAVVSVTADEHHRCLRRRETFHDMVKRDRIIEECTH